MLYTAVVYCIISFICLFAGIIFYQLLPFRSDSVIRPHSFTVYAITGLIGIALIGQWWALFLPLKIYSLLFIALLVLLLFLFRKKKVLPVAKNLLRNFRNQPSFFHASWITLLIMMVIINAGPAIMDDTDSYHIQMIKWLQEYGTVPGIANLHLRYGFNSSWFVSAAILSPHFDPINSYTLLNGLLSFWFTFYLLEKITVVFRMYGVGDNPNLFLSLLAVLLISCWIWPMTRGNAASANYDFIATCCVVILFIESLLSGDKEMKAEWVLWPAYLFTVRVLNFPLLLLSLFFLWRLIKNKDARKIGGIVLTGALLVAPFIARNVLLSGYAFFPMYQLDFFSVNWKVDRQLAMNIGEYIKYYNRVNIMYQPLEQTASLNFPAWVKAWYQHLFTYDKVLISLSIIFYAISLPALKILRRSLNSQLSFLVFVLVVQLATWFFVAPDARFAYGPLLCGFLLIFQVLPPLRAKFLLGITYSMFFVLMLIFCGIYALRKLTAPSYRNWVLPASLPQPPVKNVLIDRIEVHIPEKILNNWNARCYGTSLPCLYQLHPGLRARGKNIADGFYIDPKISYSTGRFEWY